MTAFGDIDHGPLPGGSGLLLQAPEDGRSASADGDEMDLALIDARQFGVVDNLAVEVEPLGVGSGHLVPELDEAHQFAVLIVAGQVGVGVTQAAAVLFEREECQHAWPGFALEWEVMAVESCGVAAKWDRMEIEREPIGFGK